MNFQQPQFLWGLLFLLIPLLIHLIQFRKFKTFYFPGIYRLTEIAATTRKSRNLKHWLILLSRLMLFSSLILAFAAPSCNTNINTPRNSKYILVLDASPSMWLRGKEGFPIEQAKQKAISWVQSNGSDASYAIVTGGKSQEQQWYSGAEAIRKIRDVQSETKPFQLQELDRIVQPLIQGENKSSVAVYFFTDANQDVFNTYEKVNSSIPWNIIQVISDEGWQNYAIDSALIEGITSNNLKCWVSRSRATEDVQMDLKIIAQKKLVGIQKLNFAANQSQIEIVFPLPNIDLSSFQLSIEDGALQYDNNLFCHSFKQPKSSVLLTNNNTSFQNLIKVQSTKLELAKVNSDSASKRTIRIFNPETNTSPSDWEQINEWTQNGSSVLIAPGKMIDVALESGKGIWITVPQDIANQGLNHPIFGSAFKEKIEETTVLPQILSYLKLPQEELNNWEAVLSLKNGDPLLLYRPMGEGEMWMWLSDIQSGSAKFFKSSWFVPVFTQIMLGKNGLNYPVFGRLEPESLVPVPKEFGLNINQPIALRLGKDEWSSSLAYAMDGLSISTGIESNTPGFYTVTSKGVNPFLVGLNLPIYEKAMAPLTPELRDKLEKSNFNFVSNIDFNRSLSASSKAPSLANWFFIAALFFVLLEMLLLLFTFRTKQVNSQPQS